MKAVIRNVLVASAALGVLLVMDPATAQEMENLPQAGSVATQSLRPYWHVFIAYAIAIVAVLGWVVSLSRRMAHLETRLSSDA